MNIEDRDLFERCVASMEKMRAEIAGLTEWFAAYVASGDEEKRKTILAAIEYTKVEAWDDRLKELRKISPAYAAMVDKRRDTDFPNPPHRDQ